METNTGSLRGLGIIESLAPSAGLNLSNRQEDGREESEKTTVCETGPGVHRPSAHRWNHLPRDL